MRFIFGLIVAAFILAVLAWEFVPIQVKIWDGSFDLTVRIESHLGQPQSVSCEAFGHREVAEEAVASLLPPDSYMWSKVADPFGGRPLTVRVAVSGRESAFGRELQRSQFQYLAVIAVLPDGRRIGKVVEIPDGRQSREVSVVFEE